MSLNKSSKNGSETKVNKKICWYRVLKNISYILEPILIALLIALIFCLTYPLERKSIKNGIDYFDTNTFAENYAIEIFSALNSINVLESNIDNESYIDYNIYTEYIKNNSGVESINYYLEYYKNNIQWLVIDNDTKKAYTNLEYSIDTSTIEKIQDTIMQNEEYWNYQNGVIDTSIEKLGENNIEYIEGILKDDALENLDGYRRKRKYK